MRTEARRCFLHSLSSIDKVQLQTNPGCTSHFLTSQTFVIFIIKNYQNLIIGFQDTVENVGDVFFETQCNIILPERRRPVVKSCGCMSGSRIVSSMSFFTSARPPTSSHVTRGICIQYHHQHHCQVTGLAIGHS